MTDKTKSGVWKAKLTEQKHRFDVLGFLSEQCMNGTDEDMYAATTSNTSLFFLNVFFLIQFFVIFHGSPMRQSLLFLPYQV